MRILILGAAGMLGHKLWQHLDQRFDDVHATLRATRASYARFGLFDSARIHDGVDAADSASLARVLDQLRPAVIVNCIAVTKRREAAADSLASIELNAALPHRLAAWTTAHGARLIHFSTDCVFDGRAGGYTEDSPTNAEDVYGKSKALGEVAGLGMLTLRTSFIGRELGRGTELLEWFLAQRGRRIQGYRRALYTGVSTLWMAGLVADLIERFPQLNGLYQVASPVVSKLELLGLAQKAYNLPVTIDPDDTVIVLRNLDGSRFRHATGIEVPSWERMMTELAADPTPYARWSATDAA
jgi:dTDP-4-dehydrorhamnose reductase